MSSPALADHGILTEKSDIRAHVSVVNKTVYVFLTKNGVYAIEHYNLKKVVSSQEGVKGDTSEGYLCPINKMDGLQTYPFPEWAEWSKMEATNNTSKLGELAEECVLELINLGFVPFRVCAIRNNQIDTQITGMDIIIHLNYPNVQVKCDKRVGETKNLYLETKERNPKKCY